MKKILLFASALAGLFFASCQRESLEPMAGGAVTFTVTTPGGIDTRTIADGENVNKVHWAVYKTNSNEEFAVAGNDGPLAQGAVDMTAKRATVEMDLLQDQYYTVIFWAQVEEAGHYEIGDLRNITARETTVDGNDESRAAFYAVKEFDTKTQQNYEVTLHRPFAQLNLGTTNESLSPDYSGVTQSYTIDVTASKVSVYGLSSTFNTIAGAAVEGNETHTFNSATIPADFDPAEVLTVNGTDYHYVAMNYLFVPENDKLVKVSYEIATDKGTIENTIDNVPVKANYRTNIIGNLLTSKTDFQIVVDESFQSPDILLGDDWNYAGNYQYSVNSEAAETALSDILAHADAIAREAATKAAAPEVTINLNGDVYWATGAGHGSTPLLTEDSPISAVVINGNGNAFIATGAGVGPVRLANGGKLTFNDVKVVDKSVSYAEGSWEFGYLEMAGVLELNDCEVVNAIMIEGETAVFNGCSFNSNHDNEYAVWVNEGTAYFNDCTIAGARGIKTHEAYGSEVDAVVIDGCVFDSISKKPGIALGTLNAETTVSITNSAFINCQAGDQNLYIYETDTDVDTFDFTCEGNDVTNTKAELLSQRLENAQAGDEVKVPAGEYTFPSSKINAGVTLVCDEGTVFTGNSKLNINGATVIGATFSNPSGTVADGTINGTFKDCVFEGSNALRYCYAGETVVFENCVFSGSTYAAHFDGGANNILFKNCTFSGFNAFAGAVELVTFDGCTFKGNGKSAYNGANLWGSATLINTKFEFDGSTANEWVDCISSEKSYEFTGCTINGGSPRNPAYIFSRNAGTKIVFDGVEYTYKTGDYYASASEAYVTNAATFQAALDANEAKIVLMPGTYEGTVAMKSNVTVEGTEGTVVHCINLNGADNVTLKNIAFDAAGAQISYDWKLTAKQYANIISGDKDHNSKKGSHNLLIDGCKFTGTFANGGTPIAFTDYYRTSGFSGNVTVQNCTFDNEGAYYCIYGHYTGDSSNGHGDFVIKNNVFKTAFPQGLPVYLGRYASSTPVVVEGNIFETVTSLENAVYVQDHSNYGVSVNAENNTFAK